MRDAIIFMLGGLVASVLFYPRKPKYHKEAFNFICTILSIQFHTGVQRTQLHGNLLLTLPKGTDGLANFSNRYKHVFEADAQYVIEQYNHILTHGKSK